jgi:hypothetical protein
LEKVPIRRSTSCSSPNDDQHAAAVLRRPLQHLLQLVHPVVAEGAQLGAGEAAAVEDRGVIAGIADHRVAGLEDRPEAADVRLVSGGEDQRVLGPHPVRDLALQVDVQRRRAVHEAGPRQRGAVVLQRVAGRLLDPRVAGQAEVVVGAEHDHLVPLHLHHRPGLRLDQAEVGEEVVLLGRFELLEAVVAAGLLEYVDGGSEGHSETPRARLAAADRRSPAAHAGPRKDPLAVSLMSEV